MIIKPIIPIPLMIIITIVLIIVTILTAKKTKLVVRILIILLFFIINLRPMIPNGNVEVLHSNIDMIFVIDTTLSMDAEDYNGNSKRLEGVAKDVEYIMNKVPGAYYSVITFDNKAVTKLPLTVDASAVLATVETLKTPEDFYAKGSTITVFKDELQRGLESSRKKDNRYTVVFVLTDGENTTDKKEESLKSLKKLIDEGCVLGYGTSKGGYIKVEQYDGTMEYLEDHSDYPYKKAISKIDEDNLKTMAKEMDIDYVHMTKTKNIDSKLKDLNKMKNNSSSEKEESYQDIYYYISPVLMVLFAVELFLDRRSRL